MKNPLRIWTIALAAALTLGTASGCQSGPAEQEGGASGATGGESGELVFWTQDSEVWSNWFAPAVDEFRAAHPGIKVTAEFFPSFSDKMTQAYAAGQEPDVAQTWQGVSHWAKAGKLLPVPDSFELDQHYYEGALLSKMYDGKYYCVPSEINIESPSLYVNMDILEEAGISLPDGWIENNGPKTWDELVAFAKPLTKIENGIVLQSGLAYTYAQWEATFMSLIWQHGGDYRDPDNNAVKFQTPEARKAVEFLLKYTDPGDPDCISDRGNSRYDLFVQGNAAMCMGAPWYGSGFAVDNPDLNYQVFSMPPMVAGSEPYCLSTGGWGYIVAANTKSPDAAWTFVEFMDSPEKNGSWAVNCGALSARKDAVMQLDYDPNVGSPEKALSIAADVLQYGKEDGAYMISPSTLVYNIARTQLQQVLETGDIDTCLRVIEEEGNKMIQENLER